MLVVADSSPLIVLGSTGDLLVLPALFETLCAPPEVFSELASANRPTAIRAIAASPPAWLSVRAPTIVPAIPGLHAGETAAISLATELKADAILIDERRGRVAAKTRGLAVVGTIGVLELAADRRLIDLEAAFKRVEQTDFWISKGLLNERLRLFRERAQGR